MYMFIYKKIMRRLTNELPIAIPLASPMESNEGKECTERVQLLTYLEETVLLPRRSQYLEDAAPGDCLPDARRTR